MNSLGIALAAVGAALAAATAVGCFAGQRWTPRSGDFLLERVAWSFALACVLVAAATATGLAFGLTPGRIPFLVLAAAVAGAARVWSPAVPGSTSRSSSHAPGARSSLELWASAALVALVAAGFALYCLRALTEPMWSNDFLAIWGLKGKVLFSARGFPNELRGTAYGFSHPEYPLGLPLLYAGVSFLAARWDDHALAVLFPAIQAATLLALYGWLRRRGVSRIRSLGAAVVLAWFRPLYSGFTTGLADVPFSGAALLFGSALCDTLEESDSGAVRRLILAAVLAAGIKNEGLFLAAAGAAVAVFSSSAKRRTAAVAAIVPAAAVSATQRLLLGNAPLRDFDFGLLGPRLADLPGRLAESLFAALQLAAPAWPALLGVLVIGIAGRRTPAGGRLLAMAAACLAAYALLPALAVLGPRWLIATSFARTTAALAPLAAAALASRLRPDFAPVHPAQPHEIPERR